MAFGEVGLLRNAFNRLLTPLGEPQANIQVAREKNSNRYIDPPHYKCKLEPPCIKTSYDRQSRAANARHQGLLCLPRAGPGECLKTRLLLLDFLPVQFGW
ncbi:hypothetical protein V1282_002373 [Nitrobacteraceae bacterium AZCC 2146]